MASLEELVGLVGEVKQGVGGMAERMTGLERRLGRVEAGRPGGFVPGDTGEKATAGAVAREAGFAAWLQATLVEGDPVKGGVLVPPDQADEVWAMLGAASIGLASGFRVIDTDSDELSLPVVSDDGANWVAEATEIPLAEPGFAAVVARPRKLAALVELSNELIEDSSPAALQTVSDSVVRALARKLDSGFFVGSGTAPEIRGLFNTAGIQTIGTVGAISTLGPILNAIALLEAADMTATALYMHPGAWADFMAIPEVTGSNVPALAATGGVQAGVQRSLLGVPVYVSSQLPLDKIGVAQADQIAAVRRSEARVETSSDAMFSSDVTVLRCLSRWDIVLPNPEAFVALTGITGVTLMAAGSQAKTTKK